MSAPSNALLEGIADACGASPLPPSTPKRGPVIESAAALAQRTLPPIRWCVRRLIPEGLVVLGGRPKQGKSWLVLQSGIAIASGQPVLGEDTERGRVLYLALEDGPRRLQDRLQVLGGIAPDRLHLAYEWSRWDEGGQEALVAWLRAYPDARMVAIDTWARIAPPSRARGDAYGDTYAVMGGVQAVAAEFGVAIVLVTHTRKTGKEGVGDFVDEVMGSSASTGAADTVLVLARERGADIATLQVTGRDVGESEINVAWQEGWRVQGAADLARRDPVVRAIVALMANGPWSGTPGDLLDLLPGLCPDHHGSWPDTPEALGKRVATLVPLLSEIGIAVERSRNGRHRSIAFLRKGGVTGAL